MDPSTNQPPSIDATSQPPAPASEKQQIIQHLNTAKNVLVTVGVNPNVDTLAAALGLTFMLGKLDKHATAVFSGQIPSAMEFLDPEKTFENNVDSLRDFIIALDREKADKLRYKVEDDVVKIFITPYRTTLKKEDFEFSQGDFNVDAVVALGVHEQADLDRAITAHGRILHDATVITINNDTPSSLGVIDWTDTAASSISEMLMGVSESFGSGLLDEQIGTAYLTGIVAATNRFSNEKTTPKVMTMAAQLMAAGANQQLIASNLRREGMITEEVRIQSENQPQDDGELSLRHDKDSKKEAKPAHKSSNQQTAKQKTAPAGTKKAAAKPSQQKPAVQALEPTPPAAQPEPVKTELHEPEIQKFAPPPIPPTVPQISQAEHRDTTEKPLFGGTLNATTAHAQEAAESQTTQEEVVNNLSLSHDSGEAQDAPSSTEAIAEARRAVEEAAAQPPFNPAHNPTVSVGAQTALGSDQIHPVDTTVLDRQAGGALPQQAEAAPAVPAVDASLQPTPVPAAVSPVSPPALSADPTVPPLPPLPNVPADGSMPPLPPLPPVPGQTTDPTAAFQPQTNPDFMATVGQSQNAWSQAGQEVAASQAGKDAARQAKLDERGAQYDAAVDRNRELQGLPPVNQNPNDHSTFPLP